MGKRTFTVEIDPSEVSPQSIRAALQFVSSRGSGEELTEGMFQLVASVFNEIHPHWRRVMASEIEKVRCEFDERV